MSRPSLMVSREINPGRFSWEVVLRFHQYIDKHSLSPLGAFREAPGENKQYAFAVLARISLVLPSVHSCTWSVLVSVRSKWERYCVSTLSESVRSLACVCKHNRLFRVDLCGALRQNVRCDPAWARGKMHWERCNGLTKRNKLMRGQTHDGQ